jgi:predicted dehydrogenase
MHIAGTFRFSFITMTTTKTLRAGVIGCGEIGQRGHIPGLKAAGVDVIAVCDSNLSRAKETAEKNNIANAYGHFGELLADDDIDLVTIGLPNALHAPVTISALQAGKHVLCEKPMSITSADAAAMIEASQRAGKLLSINQHMRFDGTSLAMRDAVASGSFGQVYLTDVRMIRPNGIPGYGSWFTNKDLAGAGALFDIGVHMLDLAMFISGFPAVKAVKGFLSSALGEQKLGLGGWGIDRGAQGRFDVDDTAMAFITLANGGIIRLIVTWAAMGLAEERVVVYGTQGGADRSPLIYGNETPLKFYRADDNGKIDGYAPDMSHYQGGGWIKAIASFADAVRGVSPLLVLPEQALLTTRILEKIRESAASGVEVTF